MLNHAGKIDIGKKLFHYIEDYVIRYVFFKGYKSRAKFFNIFNRKYHLRDENDIALPVRFCTELKWCSELNGVLDTGFSSIDFLIITVYDYYYGKKYAYIKPLMLFLDTDIKKIEKNDSDSVLVIDHKDVIWATLACMRAHYWNKIKRLGKVFVNDQFLLLRPMLQAINAQPKRLIKKALSEIKDAFKLIKQDEWYNMLISNILGQSHLSYNDTVGVSSIRERVFEKMLDNTFFITIGRLRIKVKVLNIIAVRKTDIKTINILLINLANFFTNTFVPIPMYDINAVFNNYVSFNIDIDWLSENIIYIRSYYPTLYYHLKADIRLDNVGIRINRHALKWIISSLRMIKYLMVIQRGFIPTIKKIYKDKNKEELVFAYPTSSI